MPALGLSVVCLTLRLYVSGFNYHLANVEHHLVTLPLSSDDWF